MERDDLLVLVDEDGVEQQYELLDAFELGGLEYVVLIPYVELESEEEQDAEELEDEEVIILRKEKSKNGEDTFATIDDDEELDIVFDEFNLRMEDEFDQDNNE